jgi:hypothetical protein
VNVQLCQCPGAELHQEDQMLQAGLFPASFKIIKTAFTFQVLDDFRTSNLECKTSGYHYFRKLRRLTSPAYPDAISVISLLIYMLPQSNSFNQDRYQELLRVSREWRDLKLWKWAGWGHNPPVLTPDTPHGGPAKLATFCSTCPQPSINLPNNWQEDPNKQVIPLNAQHLQIIHIDFLQGSIYPAVH